MPLRSVSFSLTGMNLTPNATDPVVFDLGPDFPIEGPRGIEVDSLNQYVAYTIICLHMLNHFNLIYATLHLINNYFFTMNV